MAGADGPPAPPAARPSVCPNCPWCKIVLGTLFQVEIKTCPSDVDSDEVICAGGSGKGVCSVILLLKFVSSKILIQGDSGGPLTTMKELKNGEGRIHTLVGIVSFGDKNCGKVTSNPLA